MTQFDFNSLTLDECEQIENLTGLSIDMAFADGKPKGKALRSFLWVIGKRSNPNYTIEEAGKLTLTEAMQHFKGDDAKKD
jgi:hypothetical protein